MIGLMIVSVTSILLAAITSVIAWRMSGDEKRRSEARIAALAAEIHQERPSVVGRLHLDMAGSSLFVPRPARAGSRAFAMVCGGALVFGAAAALAILTPRGLRGPARGANPVAHASAPAASPLELVALGHERVGDQLTVRGIVRNPPAGTGLDRLTAVVLLFTPDGGFLESGRAVIEAPALRPGADSAFVVTVPRAGDAGRYRVSFRTADHPVSHVDRRHEQS